MVKLLLKFPDTLPDNIFYREILTGLKDLKTLYDFFGRMPDINVDTNTIRPLFKKPSTLASFPKIQYPLLPPEDKLKAIKILVTINQICRFISSKVRYF